MKGNLNEKYKVECNFKLKDWQLERLFEMFGDQNVIISENPHSITIPDRSRKTA